MLVREAAGGPKGLRAHVDVERGGAEEGGAGFGVIDAAGPGAVAVAAASDGRRKGDAAAGVVRGGGGAGRGLGEVEGCGVLPLAADPLLLVVEARGAGGGVPAVRGAVEAGVEGAPEDEGVEEADHAVVVGGGGWLWTGWGGVGGRVVDEDECETDRNMVMRMRTKTTSEVGEVFLMWCIHWPTSPSMPSCCFGGGGWGEGGYRQANDRPRAVQHPSSCRSSLESAAMQAIIIRTKSAVGTMMVMSISFRRMRT